MNRKDGYHERKLISRVGRIVSGSFNAMVSAIENAVPETVMQEAISEIDSAIDDVRTELGKVLANKHLANTRLSEEKANYEALTQKIELAVKESRDDLAETAIARQLDIEAQVPILEATLQECAKEEKELEGYVSALLAKKRQMETELRQFRKSQEKAGSAQSTVDGCGSADGSAEVDGRVRKAESAFERVMEKATGLPGSSTDMDRKSAAQLAELDAMARKNRIQERLAAIKTKAFSK